MHSRTGCRRITPSFWIRSEHGGLRGDLKDTGSALSRDGHVQAGDGRLVWFPPLILRSDWRRADL